MAFDNHGHLFKAGVSCPFADTVDGHFHLACTVEYALHGVGRGHTQVVVAMGGDDGLVDTIHMLHQVLYLRTVFVGQAVSRCVGDVHYRSTGFDDRFDDTCQIFVLRASRIFGIKLHILHVALGIFYCGYSPFDNLFAVGVELVLDVCIAGADTRMDSLVFGKLQRFGGHVDIALYGAGQGTDGGPCHRF